MLQEDGSVTEAINLSVQKGNENTVWLQFTPQFVHGYKADLVIQIPFGNIFRVSAFFVLLFIRDEKERVIKS